MEAVTGIGGIFLRSREPEKLAAWYAQHLEGAFDSGICGWWNDEADDLFDKAGLKPFESR